MTTVLLATHTHGEMYLKIKWSISIAFYIAHYHTQPSSLQIQCAWLQLLGYIFSSPYRTPHSEDAGREQHTQCFQRHNCTTTLHSNAKQTKILRFQTVINVNKTRKNTRLLDIAKQKTAHTNEWWVDSHSSLSARVGKSTYQSCLMREDIHWTFLCETDKVSKAAPHQNTPPHHTHHLANTHTHTGHRHQHPKNYTFHMAQGHTARTPVMTGEEMGVTCLIRGVADRVPNGSHAYENRRATPSDTLLLDADWVSPLRFLAKRSTLPPDNSLHDDDKHDYKTKMCHHNRQTGLIGMPFAKHVYICCQWRVTCQLERQADTNTHTHTVVKYMNDMLKPLSTTVHHTCFVLFYH